MINTGLLNLDQFLPEYNSKTVGRIDVCLVAEHSDPAIKTVEVSEKLSYQILPSYLHTVRDFVFLNRLGGWDTVNFGGNKSADFKTTSSTYYKTLAPNFSKHSQIESVAYKTVQEQFVVQTSPLTKQEVECLRELSASTVVYELATQRYILVDDLALKYNNQDDLFQVEMKYHYTDTFNGQMRS